tara:strand:+ start:482 stop:1273 length:792 start_codon:yes stop_codon:yes gene_type:complete
METGNKKLIFYIFPKHFYFGKFDIKKKSFETLESLKNNEKITTSDMITKVINKFDQSQIQSISVSVNLENETFIPNQLYDKNNLNYYFPIKDSSRNKKTHLVSKQRFANCYCITSIDVNLKEIFKNYLHKTEFRPFGSLLVDYAIYSNENSKEVYMNIHHNLFNMAIVENKNLIFCNSFNYKNLNDFKYYFLKCIKFHEINQRSVICKIISNTDIDSKFIDIIKEFMLNVSSMDKPNLLSYEDSIPKNSLNNFLNIFSQVICE